MIIDVTGAELIPGKGGQDCPGGNKYYLDCCNECDYYLCCYEKHSTIRCIACDDPDCPRTGHSKKYPKKVIKIAEKLVEILKLDFDDILIRYRKKHK